MIGAMIEVGAVKNRLIAKIIGGACMFESAMLDPGMNIGERNIQAVKKVLSEENIIIKAEDTGKNYGRTVELYVCTGRVIIRSARHGVKEL